MTASTWYKDFSSHNLAWMLAVFTFMSVMLSAMQVVVEVTRGGWAFNNAPYGFSIASLSIATEVTLLLLFM